MTQREDLTSVFNSSYNIAAGGSALLEFKITGGASPTRAKRINIRVESTDTLYAGKVPFIYTPDPNKSPFSATASNFFLYNGESFLTIEGTPIAKMHFINTDGARDIDIYVDAASDVDIEGTTIT